MGLKMEFPPIHVPTIPLTRFNTSHSMNDANKSLSDLVADKNHLESELKDLSSVLDSVSSFLV